jgi:predicted enzyme related to lactoylglutathione lyase
MNPQRNPVGWFEIYVRDMKRAKAFYEAVFETKLEKLPSGDVEMYVFPADPNKPGSGGSLVRMEGVEASSGLSTLVYFSCADCAVEAARAPKAGGKIFKEKCSIGPYGHISLVVDTEGNMFGLHSMS